VGVTFCVFVLDTLTLPKAKFVDRLLNGAANAHASTTQSRTPKRMLVTLVPRNCRDNDSFIGEMSFAGRFADWPNYANFAYS
jgi:hypothetical protein